MAVAAAGLVLGVGASVTLAAWTDTEWVFGGNGAGGPGVGTSTFEVQQSTAAPFTAFGDEEDNPGGEVVFAPDALDLTPGDTVYAMVALRTTAASVGGDVTLQPAVEAAGIVANDPAGLLFDALEVGVIADDAPFTCDATAFAGAPGAPALIADGALGASGGTAAQTLAGAAGSTQYYCFALTLPDDIDPADGTTSEDYIGLTAAPAWEFLAESAPAPLP